MTKVHAISRFGIYAIKYIASPLRLKIDDVSVVEELAVTPHGNASSSHGGQQEHSHQSVFLTILIGGQPELSSRLLAISSGSEATWLAMAAQVLLSSRYRNSSSVKFCS